MNISKLIEQLASMREGHGDVEVRLMHGHDTLAYESEIRGVCCSKYLSDKTDLKLEGLRQNSLSPELPPSTRALEREQYYRLMRQRTSSTSSRARSSERVTPERGTARP
jgi:hypothetical protein